MPTLGWVYEDAWESKLGATESVPDPANAGRPAFRCPSCASQFQQLSELQEHLAGAHPVARPFVLIAGEEPSDVCVVRKSAAPSEIVFVNTTCVKLANDANPPAPTDIRRAAQIIAATRLGRVRLILEHAPARRAAPTNWRDLTTLQGVPVGLPHEQQAQEPVCTEYDLEIAIPAIRELDEVDSAFHNHINVEKLCGDNVTAFLRDKRCSGAAHRYATAMAEYAFGVLAKEGSSRVPGEPVAQYRKQFGSALIELASYRRPLPGLLSAFMRFSMNTFVSPNKSTGHVGLDAAIATLAEPEKGFVKPVRPNGGEKRNICPIDHGTDRILRLNDRLASATRWSSVLNDECRQVATASTLHLEDQEKAFALWALAAMQHKATRDAREPLERLSATFPFADWASKILDSIEA